MKTRPTPGKLAPGGSITAFNTHERELAVAMQEAVYSGATEFSFCFCSIFDQCWIQDGSKTAVTDPVQSVGACPDYGDEAFLD